MSLKFKKTKQGLDISWGGGISLNGKSILDYIYPIDSYYISRENVSPASLIGGIWEQQSSILIPKNKTYSTIIHNAVYPYSNYLIAYTNSSFNSEESSGMTLYNNWGGGNFAKFLTKSNTIKGLNLGVDLSSDVETWYVWKRVES